MSVDHKDPFRPQAKAIPKEGYFEREQGKYGPVFPRTPACHGFTIIAKIKPGREKVFREYGKKHRGRAGERSLLSCAPEASLPALGPIRYRQRYVLHVPGHLRHRFRQIHRRCSRPVHESGINTVFENLEGFPEDWKTNVPAFIKFVRDHHCPSFLEYGEYPYVTADEIKKALRLKKAFSEALDQMQ